MYNNMSFEEYSKIQYEELKKMLRAFDPKEVEEFWNSEQELVKKAYDNFVTGKYHCKVALADGLAYGLSLMF